MGPDVSKIERVLRAQFVAHNFRVAGFATLTLIASLAIWWALHATALWLALLFVTAAGGVGAQMPVFMDRVFWIASAALLAVAWADRLLRPDDRPKDHKSIGELFWECLLAVPRLTLSIWATLSAWQRLSQRELADASALIERLLHEPRLPMHSLPVEMPNAASRFKILFALQLVQIIDVRREDRALWVTLNPLRPPELKLAAKIEATPPDRLPVCGP